MNYFSNEFNFQFPSEPSENERKYGNESTEKKEGKPKETEKQGVESQSHVCIRLLIYLLTRSGMAQRSRGRQLRLK